MKKAWHAAAANNALKFELPTIGLTQIEFETYL